MKARAEFTRTGQGPRRSRIERVREAAIRAALDDLAERRRREAGEGADIGTSDAMSRSGAQSNGS
jgi:hypothetical protein